MIGQLFGAYNSVYPSHAISQPSAVWAARRLSNPEAAVEPVTPVRPTPDVAADQGRLFRQELPTLRQGVDPVEWAVRMRIQPAQPEDGEAALVLPGQQAEKSAGLPGEEAILPGLESDAALGASDVQKAAEEGECETCEKRKYQDGSDDPGVSFKTPTNVSPEMAASAVRGHEQEHVVREQAKAQREDRRVVSQTVTYHTGICPECGKAYVSGGTTRTVTAANPQEEQPDPNQKDEKSNAPFAAVA